MAEQNETTAAGILRELRDIRVELRGSRGMRGELRDRFDGLDVRIEGIAHQMRLLAGHAGRLDDRLAHVEADRDR